MNFAVPMLALSLLILSTASAQQPSAPDAKLFLVAASSDSRTAGAALEQIAARWQNGYAAMIVDVARLMLPSAAPSAASDTITLDVDVAPGADPLASVRMARVHPSARARARLIRFLERQTGRRFGDDLWKWREWMWQLPYEPHPEYRRFKGEVYAQIDPKFREFFGASGASLVRLDEIDWGGVAVNGIPPLVYPSVVPAGDARYLDDTHVIFGIVVNGQARAYPKRILAWHELARDRVGGVDLTVVYCTLCGTVIPYESRVAGVTRTFGTSGLLYRSNKLMFDEETMSLWSTLEGRPVVGPLAGSGLELRPHPVVTTTWGEWKAEHPDTTVLALATGFDRDYREGAAYREYFSHDRLMFAVPRTDRRLKNKAEVLSLFVRGASGARVPVAVSADLLKRNPVFHLEAGGRRFVVFTTKAGANRVYEAAGHSFTSSGGVVSDTTGAAWRMSEDALETAGRRLARVPARRTFWFAWYAQFPDTALVK